MKIIVLALTLILTSFVAKSQVFFKNSYDEPVWVSLAYYSSTKEYKGWVTKGWVKIAPGEKKEILKFNPMGQYLYYYAETKGTKKKFEGKTIFLAHPSDAFIIKNADKEYVQKETPAYKWYKFREINKGGADIVKLKYTIDFKY